uniref:Mitochondrial import receptor subunit TOM34 isoform X1 n=1 Tax=Pogona vitticeps TaxID=103695 RepID=A0ABM5G5V8_9SAUR
MAPASQIAGLKQAGNEQFRNGQYSQAAALYGRALELLEAAGDVNAEEKSILYSNRAACYLKDGNCSLCIKDCSDALELVPFGIKPLLRRAAAYEALERYSLAYVDYKTVLQVDCSVQAAHDGINRMTKALLEKDGFQWRQKLPPIPAVPVSAQRRWEPPPSGNQETTTRSKAKDTATVRKQVPIAAATEQANALKLEGNEFVKKGNYKKAVEKYTESLKLHKLESTTYTNRALCYLTLKQYKEAIQDCSEALKIDPKNIKAFYRRAQAYKQLKNILLAVLYSQNHYEATYIFLQTENFKNDYKSSKADINSLLKIEPQNSAAMKLLQELNKLLK